MVLTRQFTEWSMLADILVVGCQGLSQGKKIGTCQHVLLKCVPALTLARRTSWSGMQRVPLFVLPQWARNIDCTRAGRRNISLGSISLNNFITTCSITTDDLKLKKIDFNKLVFPSCNLTSRV
jgi:hypothetical protein